MAWLSFGRLRTLHLNLVAYGWAPMATLGTALWMMPRLLKTKLLGGRVAIAGAVLWNVGLIIGLASIASGHNDGMERSEEHTSELQSLMRISYAVFCLKKKNTNNNNKWYKHQ